MLKGDKAKSSPRTWGCFPNRGTVMGADVVFPTHVGVFPESPSILPRRVSLPHARGGVSSNMVVRSRLSGSSPRTWGCFQLINEELLLDGVFPTHVGVFLTEQAQKDTAAGLPHARGGVS